MNTSKTKHSVDLFPFGEKRKSFSKRRKQATTLSTIYEPWKINTHCQEIGTIAFLHQKKNIQNSLKVLKKTKNMGQTPRRQVSGSPMTPRQRSEEKCDNRFQWTTQYKHGIPTLNKDLTTLCHLPRGGIYYGLIQYLLPRYGAADKTRIKFLKGAVEPETPKRFKAKTNL